MIKHVYSYNYSGFLSAGKVQTLHQMCDVSGRIMVGRGNEDSDDANKLIVIYSCGFRLYEPLLEVECMDCGTRTMENDKMSGKSWILTKSIPLNSANIS